MIYLTICFYCVLLRNKHAGPAGPASRIGQMELLTVSVIRTVLHK